MSQAVHKAVRDTTTHHQGMHKEVRSKLFESAEIVVVVVNDVCEEPASEECVRQDDVHGSDEPLAQISFPNSVVGITEEKC